MPTVTLPPDIQRELDWRRDALQLAERTLGGIDAEVRLFLTEKADERERRRQMRDQLINEIELIELIAKSLSEQIAVDNAAEPADKPTASAVVLRAMEEANRPLKGAEIIEATGLNRSAVGVTLHNLRRKALVKHDREAHLWSIA